MKLNQIIYETGLVKFSTDQGYRIIPLNMKWDKSKGVSLMNPSIMVDNEGKLRCNIRCVNYNLYHSESLQFPHWSGPVQYIHPENDVRLATENFIVSLDNDFNIISGNVVEMQKLHEPLWEFHGLEDGRLVQWEGRNLLIGVRRDTTTNGEGRMEITQLDEEYKTETLRMRIPTPNDVESYCEKNWMPILDKPLHFVKWSSPTEVVRYDPFEHKTYSVTTNKLYTKRDIRGGSHVVRWGDYYVAIGHSVDLWKPYAGEKDSRYYHHFIVWDSNFNLVYISDEFKFTDTAIEFCCGLCEKDGLYYASFSVMDNGAYIIEMDLNSILGEVTSKVEINKDHRIANKFLYDWIDNQNDVQVNINYAEFLYHLGQVSQAITHYSKALDNLEDDQFEAKYHCLCMISKGFEDLGYRFMGSRQFSRFAKMEQPDRPEAYALLARQWISELNYKGVDCQYDWIQVLENAKIGLLWAQVKDYPETTYYKGIDELRSYYLLSLEKLGRLNEVKEFINSSNFSNSSPQLKDTIISISDRIQIRNPFFDFSKLDLEFESKFLSKLNENYSQALQDLFVLTCLESKGKNYLEVGSNVPEFNNNTYLLEKWGWEGISLDLDASAVNKFNKLRRNKCYYADALAFDYEKHLEDIYYTGKGNIRLIDYLSLDVDGANLEALYRIPFNKYEFKVITFEHDLYARGSYIKDRGYEYLTSLGYQRVGDNIKYNTSNAYEDWYINPKYIKDPRILRNIYKLIGYIQSI